MNNSYQADSIKTLDFFEHIRKYPGMYIGSKDIKGLHHCIKEIISNSIDEYLNGAGDTILIKIQKDGGILIKDNARGIPHGEHSKGISTLQACFGVQNTGGKYINASGEGGYNTSGGEHGIGSKAVNALSTKLIVTSTRDGIAEMVEFSKGKFIKTESKKAEGHGLSVLFYPDAEIFETIKIDIKNLEEMIREFSFLCSGLRFVYEVESENKKEEFYSENGLEDYIQYLSNGKNLLFNPIYLKEKENNFQVEAIIGYTSNYSGTYKLYTNNIPQEKGTHLTGFKTAWTSSLNQWARDKKILKEKDENLSGSDFEEGQILILNFKMIDPVFKGQNKEELSSSEGRTYVQRLIADGTKNYFDIHEKDIKIILEKAILARKAREAAKKARDNARDKVPKAKAKLLNLPSKLVDANVKDRTKAEIFITEGDSAAGGLIAARDPETQAIFPIRGKIINLYKNSDEKVFANQEVNNLIKALGLDFDTKTKTLIYDKNKLRYDKIFTACDADPDGMAIKNLLLTCIWSLCPELIINGHMWITMPPLYRITKGKDTYIYIKDNDELERYKEEHKNEKYLINRNKGLGEQDADELGPCILDKETRNVSQVTVEDVEEANRLFDILMGTNVPIRREWLLQHSEEASEDLW